MDDRPTETEAACLLDHGQAYRRRAGLRQPSGELVFAGFKPGGFSLYFGDLPYYHFDLEGRWQRALVGGVHYLKSLDASAESIERVRRGEAEGGGLSLRRRALPFAEARDLDESIRATALDLLDALDSGRLAVEAPPAPASAIDREGLRAMLERVAGWDADAWFRQREAYLGTYGPLPILPPSCPAPIVLQAALGHASGRPFGGAGPAEPYLRTPDEFEAHAREVARLLGRRAALARGVVIAGGDFLRRSADEAAPYFEAAARVFPLSGGARPRLSDRPEEAPWLDGVYAFLDDPAPPRPDREGFARLRALGLKRVDVGVESPSPEVRAAFGRGWADGDLRDLIADLHAAGIGVGVLLLAGAGRGASGEADADATTGWVSGLGLGRDDHLYLLDADELAAAPGRGPVAADRGDRLAASRRALTPLARASGFKVVPYTLEKQ
jgi:hypothetical protein